MTPEQGTAAVSLQEALARDIIRERISDRHRLAPRSRHVRRHVRTALLLRRLAARLDPEQATPDAPQHVCAGPVPVEPRPRRAVRRSPAPPRH